VGVDLVLLEGTIYLITKIQMELLEFLSQPDEQYPTRQVQGTLQVWGENPY